MKRGDKYPVTIAGQVVTQAEVREVGDGTATLVVPGTIVVMATRTELTDAPRNTEPSGTETIVEGVERTSSEEVQESTDDSGNVDAETTAQGTAPAEDNSAQPEKPASQTDVAVDGTSNSE